MGMEVPSPKTEGPPRTVLSIKLDSLRRRCDRVEKKNTSAQYQLDCSRKVLETLVEERKFLITKLKEKIAAEAAAEEAVRVAMEVRIAREKKQLLSNTKRVQTRRSQLDPAAPPPVRRGRGRGRGRGGRGRRKEMTPAVVERKPSVRKKAERVPSDLYCDEDLEDGDDAEDDPDSFV
eukprot:CFRG1519T1